ncbi:hypothetical protein [uncultured Enterovirga sp.]|uniref:hypothetical protein n=1 Tax=uncultured Enterovirga sp. TaxID=2026352 RepID=UPI0035CBE720
MTNGEVTVAYPDRAKWSKLCWDHPAAKDPFACRELARALTQTVRKGNRANDDPEASGAERRGAGASVPHPRSATTQRDMSALVSADEHVAQSW